MQISRYIYSRLWRILNQQLKGQEEFQVRLLLINQDEADLDHL